MAYVPPHMRKGSNAKPSVPVKLDQDRYTIEEIQHYYWGRTREQDAEGDLVMPQHSTLNDSINSKGSLSYVLLFQGANPQWESEHIIFVKSNLNILPQYHRTKATRYPNKSAASSDPDGQERPTKHAEKSMDHGDLDGKHVTDGELPVEITPPEFMPIACFEQGRRSLKFEGFAFAGYFTVENITLLPPFSKALSHMLEQKWSHSDRRGNAQFAKRRPEDWEKSLSYEWAVIRFKKMEGENKPPPPSVEKLSARERRPFTERVQQKSVNELLADMRLGTDTGGGKHKQAKSSEASAETESSTNS